MNDTNRKQLGQTLWAIADQLRGAMNADDFRDYMLSFLFLRYLSDNYEIAARKELGRDYPVLATDVLLKTGAATPLQVWYAENKEDIPAFEKQMRRKVHYVIEPAHLWNSIANMARTQNAELLNTLQAGFKYIETESFESAFQGLFSEINLGSDKLGRTYADRNAKLCTIIQKIAEGLPFDMNIDALGDAYEYLIGQFAAGSGKKAGEFYTPQQISDILSTIVTLDSQEPKTGPKKRLESVLDFACGSGSLLLNVRCRWPSKVTHYWRIDLSHLWWLWPPNTGAFPAVLSYGLMVAAVVYLAGSFTRFVFPDYLAIMEPVYILPLLAESSFCLWLLVRGVRGQPECGRQMPHSRCREQAGRSASSPGATGKSGGDS